MFQLFCPGCQAWVLLDVGQVRGVTRLADGVLAVELACYDGQTLLTVTGAAVTGAMPEGAGTPPQPAHPDDRAAEPSRAVSVWRRAAASLVRGRRT